MDSNSKHNLNIVYWNAQSIQPKILAFYNFIEQNNIDIALINETWLRDHQRIRKNSNYFIYRLDRSGRRHGGVAIFVRESICHQLLTIPKTKVIEVIGIRVNFNDGEFFDIFSCYFPGSNDRGVVNDFRNDILSLTNKNNKYFLCGDFNSRHRLWGCLRANKTGNILHQEFSRDRYDIVSPPTFTYIPPNSKAAPSTLDLILTNSSSLLTQLLTTDEFVSDHKAVLAVVKVNNVNTNAPKSYFNYAKAKWPDYYLEIKSKVENNIDTYRFENINEIDYHIHNVTQILLDARDKFIPKTIVKNYDNIELSEDIINMIKYRNCLRRRHQRTGDAIIKTEINRLTRNIRLLTSELINTKWNTKLESLRDASKPFFNLAKVIKKRKLNAPLISNGNILITDDEKAEKIAEVFHDSHKLTSDFSDVATITEVNDVISNSDHLQLDQIENTSAAEIKATVKKLKNKKAPGHDNIQNILIKRAPHVLFEYLCLIFNGCLKIGYFPDSWKKSIVIPVPKPTKEISNPSSYRPISLLPNISKIFETVIRARLRQFILDNSLIQNEQFGFRPLHSTSHQVNRLKHIIQNALAEKKSVGVVMLDIEKAFDSTWHNGLIYKMIKTNVPTYLVKIIQSFLSNRKFKVKMNSGFSGDFGIPAGVPQGAILSPDLFNFYIHDLPKPANCQLFLYADDLGLASTSLLPETIIANLENALEILNRHYMKWKIKINPNKTQASFFTRRRKQFLPTRDIKFGMHNIPWSADIKYLGITLDKSLTFVKHVNNNITRASGLIKTLYPFIKRNSKLSIKNKRILYKSIFRAVLTYGSNVYCTCALTHLKKLQVMQNKILKIIYNRPFFFSTYRLHQINNIELIYDFIFRLKNNYLKKLPYINNECM
jgi:hypothetical protein